MFGRFPAAASARNAPDANVVALQTTATANNRDGEGVMPCLTTLSVIGYRHKRAALVDPGILPASGRAERPPPVARVQTKLTNRRRH